MSINIIKKDLRAALDWLTLSRAFPLWWGGGTLTITYDGEWICIYNPSVHLVAIGTGYGFPAYEATRTTYYLSVCATIKAPSDDTNIYFFFLEPRKADYNNFQGFRHDGTYHCFEFRKAGAEEQDNIAGQDWTTEHEFKISHKKDETDCIGYIDGVEKAHSTDNSKISSQPYSIYCCEPNGVVRTLYLKYPPGICTPV